jgi:SAM-dependent methyltransferase
MRPVRQEIMWQAVLDAVAATGPEGPLDVLDVGGGTGGDAVRLAGLGHRVTVVDPSPDALASLGRRAAEAGVGDRVVGVLADTSDLGEQVSPRSVDLALLHGVLEHVDHPGEALRSVAGTLRDGGVVSVVVAGRPAAVLARALAGDFDGAAALAGAVVEDWDLKVQGPRRYVAAELEALLAAAGFSASAPVGLRTFADLVPSAVVDTEPGARERLYALERLVRTSRDFSAVSAGLHTLARLDLR